MTYEDMRRVLQLVTAINAVAALPDELPAKGICTTALNVEIAAIPADVREAIMTGEMPREVWE